MKKDLRETLPKNIDKAILALKEIIKNMPAKECYFNDIDDFVAPFTCTCEEEVLIQLLESEKEMENIEEDDYITFEEFSKQIREDIVYYENMTEEEREISKNKQEEKYQKQVEEGYIRKYYYRK